MNIYSVSFVTPDGNMYEELEAHHCLRYASGRCDFFDENDRLLLSVENVFRLKVLHGESPAPTQEFCDCEDCQPNVAPTSPPKSNVVTFNGLELALNEEETERLRLFLKYII